MYTLHPDSAPVPITILPDDLVETTEDFRLALISAFTRNNVDIGPNGVTIVSIQDEDGKTLFLFHQSSKLRDCLIKSLCLISAL